MAEFIITLKVTVPTAEGDSWTDPTIWAWGNAIKNGLTGRAGTAAEILNISPMQFEDEDDAQRFEGAAKQRERWEMERADG